MLNEMHDRCAKSTLARAASTPLSANRDLPAEQQHGADAKAR
jgi:hypothetical protein